MVGGLVQHCKTSQGTVEGFQGRVCVKCDGLHQGFTLTRHTVYSSIQNQTLLSLANLNQRL